MGPVEISLLGASGRNAKDLLAWVQERSQGDLAASASDLFEMLLANASQSRHSSADACVRLCGLVQLSAKSPDEQLTRWAFSERTLQDLFNFFIEWNEKDAHRSMRLVLDLLSFLLTHNPSSQAKEAQKADILSTIVAIIARKSTRPLVKSCLAALHHLLAKSVLSLEDLARQYKTIRPDLAKQPAAIVWKEWVAEVFQWMNLHYLCPVAGKLLGLIFSGLYLRSFQDEEEKPEVLVETMRDWVEMAVSANAEILESVKNYVFAPLFKSDRALSIAIVHDLNRVRPEDYVNRAELDTAALLHLAALDVGKRLSIVDEPGPMGEKKVGNVVELSREVLQGFLTHNSKEVRSFAMSLLVTSSSSTKPYSSMALELLKSHLRSCHADPDAKFRNEILGHSKVMIKRIKGATATLQRDISRLANRFPDPGVSESKSSRLPVNTHLSKGAQEISNAGETWLRETLKAHQAFFGWYLRFLREELNPTASYQRHITALKALVTILKLEKQGVYETELNMYQDTHWIRTVMDLIDDPFDDVRETATSLLMLFPPDTLDMDIILLGDNNNNNNKPVPTTPRMMLIEFCSRAAIRASYTSRADHSDGAARSLGLLCSWQHSLEQQVSLLAQSLDSLEQKIEGAERDLGHAVMTDPVHGDFAAVRYIWEILSQKRYKCEELQRLYALQTRIVGLCLRIWDAVSYVLCDESPEGHVPEELGENEGLDTKGLLSYSFRAVHESSNLMRSIICNLRFSRKEGFLLPSPDVFEKIGNLAFSQLSGLRHRGAFSSVSLNFIVCCQHCEDAHVAPPGNGDSLLETWYQGALLCIHKQRCTSRRSAGIPSLITGILASNANSPSFQDVMRTLQDIARKPVPVSETDASNLPQVHAFNCLKEIFKSSLLTKKTEAYLLECLQLATNSLEAQAWAIRNCALLFLRSLMDNLFGTNESKSSMETGWDGKTLRISYAKYSSLPSILLNLLQSGQQALEPSNVTQTSAAESVFPSLDIIRRAGPPEAHRDELYSLIVRYLGSRDWHVRELAARTLCSFLLGGTWVASIQKLLEGSHGSANRLHGALLTIKFFLERTRLGKGHNRVLDEVQDLDIILQAFENSASFCSETLAVYVDICRLIREIDAAGEIQASRSRLAASQTPALRASGLVSRALLDQRLGIKSLREVAESQDLASLEAILFKTLDTDIDTGCVLLEAVPSIWGKAQQSADLCTLYIKVCKHTKDARARAITLENLTRLMDEHISNGCSQGLLGPEEFDSFQSSLQDSINPTLANSILRVSGSIKAVQTLQENGNLSFLVGEQKLRCWGKAMAEAIKDGKPTDMRMAAARAIKSFATAVRGAVGTDAAYLPFLLALYRTLVDDDDEIRSLGASAVAHVTADLQAGHAPPPPLVAADAADALLCWMRRCLGHTHEFRAYVACRLVGDPLVAVDVGVQDLAAWAGPDEQFAAALQVDESLFAVEKQNLFVDEVTETQRWAGLFRSLDWWSPDEVGRDGGAVAGVLAVDGSLDALRAWTERALEVLVAQVGEDDGPLGWASNPDAFALCHRVLTCGRVLIEALPVDDCTAISNLLARVHRIGKDSRLHGFLLLSTSGNSS